MNSPTSPFHGFTSKEVRDAQQSYFGTPGGRRRSTTESVAGLVSPTVGSRRGIAGITRTPPTANSTYIDNDGYRRTRKPSADSRASTSTRNVSLNGAPVFLSPFSHLRTSRVNDTRGNVLHDLEEVTESETETIMSDEVKYRGDIVKAGLFVEEEICDVTQFPCGYVEERARRAEDLKNKLVDAMVFLRSRSKQWTDVDEKQGSEVRKALNTFINTAWRHIKESDNAASATPNTSNNSSSSGSATRLHLKKNNVSKNLTNHCDSAEALINEFNTLAITNPATDYDYCLMADRAKDLQKRLYGVKSKLQGVASDAADMDMLNEAVKATDVLTRLFDAVDATQEAVDTAKSDLGILGDAALNKQIDIKPPTFNGSYDDGLDYYSFKAQFEKYSDVKRLTNNDQLRVLLDTCLSGSAHKGCNDLSSVDEIWTYLRTNFGNPRILLASKIADLKKLGNCAGSMLNKKTWWINLSDQVKRVHDLATEHKITTMLYGSDMLEIVEDLMPKICVREFHDACFEHGVGIGEDTMYTELMTFLKNAAERASFDADLAVRRHQVNTSSGRFGNSRKDDARKVHYVETPQPIPTHEEDNSNDKGDKVDENKKRARKREKVMTINNKYVDPQTRDCKLCSGKHTHAYYCEEFEKIAITERFKDIAKMRCCYRCLRLDSEIELTRRQLWWKKHEVNCKTEFICSQGGCKKRIGMRQLHITMCHVHVNENKKLGESFLKTVDFKLFKNPTPKLFFATPSFAVQHVNPCVSDPGFMKVEGSGSGTQKVGYQVLPDVEGPAVYVVHKVQLDPNHSTLLFYDTGCMTAAVSDFAHKFLDTQTIRPGPTVMDVAGGRSIKLEHGEDRFQLEMVGKKMATITALRVPQITSVFPIWNLQNAFEEINKAYLIENSGKDDIPPLPTVPKSAGGEEVGIMLGQRYLKYFPQRVFSLPNGLEIYRAQFVTPDGNYGCLGGPWAGWKNSIDIVNSMTPRDYLTMELRAYFMQASTLKSPMNFYSDSERSSVKNVKLENFWSEPDPGCVGTHCAKHANIPAKCYDHWEPGMSLYHKKDDLDIFELTEGSNLAIQQLTQENATLQTRLSELQITLAEKFATLNDKVESLNTNLSSVNRALDEQKEQFGKLMKTKDELQVELNEANKKCSQLQNELTEKTKQLRDVNDEVQQLNKDKEALQKDLSMSKELAEKLTAEVKTLKAESTTKDSAIEDLESAKNLLSNPTSEIKDKSSVIEKERNENSKLRDEISVLLKSHNELNESIKRSVKEKVLNLDHLDLLCLNRLILGRSNRHAPIGQIEFECPSKLIKQMGLVTKAWWKVRVTEKLSDYVPRQEKWRVKSTVAKMGDVVIFHHEEKDMRFEKMAWRIGRIVDQMDEASKLANIEFYNKPETSSQC